MPTADMEKMKTSELRKMVKEHRKTSTTPTGKMSKVALLLELDKYAGTPSSQPSAAPAVKAQDKAVAVVKKVGNLTAGGSGGKSAAPKETAKGYWPVPSVTTISTGVPSAFLNFFSCRDVRSAPRRENPMR